MSKRTKIIIIICALVALIVAFVVYRKFTKPAGTQFIPMADGSGQTAVVRNDNFPLKEGSQGPNVKRLQIALNRIRPQSPIDEDGDFGPQTRNKLLLTVATTLSGLPMSEASFNTIIAMGNRA